MSTVSFSYRIYTLQHFFFLLSLKGVRVFFGMSPYSRTAALVKSVYVFSFLSVKELTMSKNKGRNQLNKHCGLLNLSSLNKEYIISEKHPGALGKTFMHFVQSLFRKWRRLIESAMGTIFLIRQLRAYNHRSYTNNLSKRRVSRINALEEVDNNSATKHNNNRTTDYRPHE